MSLHLSNLTTIFLHTSLLHMPFLCQPTGKCQLHSITSRCRAQSFPPRTTIFMPEQMFKQKCLIFSPGNQNISSFNRANLVIFKTQHSILRSLWGLVPHNCPRLKPFANTMVQLGARFVWSPSKPFWRSRWLNWLWTRIWAHVTHFKLASYSTHGLQKSRANIGQKDPSGV